MTDEDQRVPAGEKGARRLTLDLVFPTRSDTTEPLSVRVVVEDISEADAHAPILFETEVHDLEFRSGGSVATFAIALPDIKGAVEPAIRIHVARGATGKIAAGDFINPGVVRLPDGEDAHCAVSLVEVR